MIILGDYSPAGAAAAGAGASAVRPTPAPPPWARFLSKVRQKFKAPSRRQPPIVRDHRGTFPLVPVKGLPYTSGGSRDLPPDQGFQVQVPSTSTPKLPMPTTPTVVTPEPPTSVTVAPDGSMVTTEYDPSTETFVTKATSFVYEHKKPILYGFAALGVLAVAASVLR